jgi:hypothetical protein
MREDGELTSMHCRKLAASITREFSTQWIKQPVRKQTLTPQIRCGIRCGSRVRVDETKPDSNRRIGAARLDECVGHGARRRLTILFAWRLVMHTRIS